MRRAAAILMGVGLLCATVGPVAALPSEAAGAQTVQRAQAFLSRSIAACDDIRLEKIDLEGASQALGLSAPDETGLSHGSSGSTVETIVQATFRLASGPSGTTVHCSGAATALGLPEETLKAHIRAEASRTVPGPVVVHAAEAPIGERGRQTAYILDDKVFLLVRSDSADPTRRDDPTTVLFIMTWMAPVG